MALFNELGPQAQSLPESKIVAVVNHARERDDVIKLWVGEGDLPTPDFICDAAVQSLRNGETFYTWQRGIPPLREALAGYHERHFGGRHDPETFFVTGSGMQAIKLVIEAVCTAGDEVVYLSPSWPNITAALNIFGVQPVPVVLDFQPSGWTLDMDRLATAISPTTRALFINTPSNPTGWTATEQDLKAILDLAREKGLWIIADEIYSRFYFGGHRAPSFLDIMEEDDRILFVNTFSKNWAMTGWRAGWIKAPSEIGQTFENLIQYSTSGVAEFVQRGAVVALNDGDAWIEEQKEKARRARDILLEALTATNRVRFPAPDGAFYAFFAIDGLEDSEAAVYRLVDEAGVGLSPGAGFGPGGEAFLRACFLRRLDHVEMAAQRLAKFVSSL